MRTLGQNLLRLMSLRERFLLLCFIIVGLVVWALSILDHSVASVRTLNLNNEILSNFKETLAQSGAADALLVEARAGLDQSKTFSAPQLVGRIDSIARETNLNSFDISSPSTNSTELFSFHNVRLNIKRAQLEELIRFDQEVKKHSPYVALTQFQITANARDPRMLDAIFELVSFELKEDVM